MVKRSPSPATASVRVTCMKVSQSDGRTLSFRPSCRPKYSGVKKPLLFAVVRQHASDHRRDETAVAAFAAHGNVRHELHLVLAEDRRQLHGGIPARTHGLDTL